MWGRGIETGAWSLSTAALTETGADVPIMNAQIIFAGLIVNAAAPILAIIIL